LRSAAADFDSERTYGTHGRRTVGEVPVTTKAPPHRATSLRDGGEHESSLERFVRKMEEKQDEAIDATLDLTGDSEECAVALGEEAYWGCEETARCSGEEDPRPHEAMTAALADRQPATLVEPPHQAAPPRRGAPCSRCKQQFYSPSGRPICYNCRDRCSKCKRRYYSASGKNVCVNCRN